MNTINDLVNALASHLQAGDWMLATCESCTGGWIGKCLTDQVGSSAWYAGGLVTYSNAAKQQLARVEVASLDNYGAVSEIVAAEMASGCCQALDCQVGVAVNGVAGPGGGSLTKPVGLVCFGWRLPDKTVHTSSHQFCGDREQVRLQTVNYALQQLCEYLSARN